MKMTASGMISQSRLSIVHHYDCIALYEANSLPHYQFWGRISCLMQLCQRVHIIHDIL